MKEHGHAISTQFLNTIISIYIRLMIPNMVLPKAEPYELMTFL